MIRFIWISLFLLLRLVLAAQASFTLPLQKQPWDVEQKMPFAQHYMPRKVTSQASVPVVLSNGDSLFRYALYYIGHKEIISLGGRPVLNFLVGFNQRQQVAIVPDVNDNGIYSDDKVFLLDMSTPVSSLKEYVKRSPEIIIDSVPLWTNQQAEGFARLHFRAGVNIASADFPSSFEDLEQAKTFFLNLYPLSYFIGNVQIENEAYDFTLVKDALAGDGSGHNLFDSTAALVLQYRKLAGKDSVLKVIPVVALSNPKYRAKAIFVIGKDTFRISTAAITQPQLTFEKAAPGSAAPRRPAGENLNAQLWSIIAKSEYTVVEFSGSWCKPCQEILPALKALYSKYKNRVSFVTVAVENDSLAAEQYRSDAGISWHFLYENLNCTSVNCLKNSFGIMTYPTLILLDKKKNILFQQSGTGAIKNLQQMLGKLFN